MIAAVLMLVLGLLAARLFMKVIRVPQNVLIPIIAVLCVIGSYSVKRSISVSYTHLDVYKRQVLDGEYGGTRTEVNIGNLKERIQILLKK